MKSTVLQSTFAVIGVASLLLLAGCSSAVRVAPDEPAVVDAPSAPVIAHQGKPIGARFVPVPPGSGLSLKLDSDRGMIVAEVAPGGIAAQAGLAKGDVLLSLDDAPVNSQTDFVEALNAAAPRHKTKMELSRSGVTRIVSISF